MIGRGCVRLRNYVLSGAGVVPTSVLKIGGAFVFLKKKKIEVQNGSTP